MNKPFHLALGAVACAALLAGCGSGGDDATTTPPVVTPPVATNQFTQSGEWTFVMPASGVSVCYDFEAKAEVAGCTGAAWDLKVQSGGRTATMWTNSGTSGTGKGGAFGGPFDHTWAELQAWQNGTTDPTSGAIPAAVFLADSAKSAFTGSNDIQSAAFEYGVTGTANDHSLYPNFRVFLVTTNSGVLETDVTSKVYALQVIGYYGTTTTPPTSTGTTSGVVTFRFADRAGAAPQTVTVDASKGWVYYDLTSNTVSSETGVWQVAFNRYNVKLNGGTSGSGTVGGAIGKTPAGFYDADGKVVAAKFTATTNVVDTAADLTDTNIKSPTVTSGWIKDSLASALNPAYTGGRPPATLDYGWYKYYSDPTLATAAGLAGIHMLKAEPGRAALIRTGEGTGYARVQLSSIVYAAATPAYNGAQTWTIKYDLQPSK